jgi:hypothetical protein
MVVLVKWIVLVSVLVMLLKMNVVFVMVIVQLAGKMLGVFVTMGHLILENPMYVVHVVDLVWMVLYGQIVMVMPSVLMGMVHIVLVQLKSVVKLVMGVNRIVLETWMVLGI